MNDQSKTLLALAALACLTGHAADPITITIGPRTETTVAVPHVSKENLQHIIAAFLIDEPVLKKQFEAKLGEASELTLIITTKRGTPDASTITFTNSPAPPTNQTYTVTVADIWKHTNCVEVRWCSEFCTLVRYVEAGVTNDFHAAFAPVKVETNGVSQDRKRESGKAGK